MALYILCAVFCSACWPFLFCVRYFVRPFYLTTIFVRPVGPFLFHVQYFVRPFYLHTIFVRPVGPFCFMYSILFTLSTLHLFTLVLFCKRITTLHSPFWPSHVTLFSGAAPVRSHSDRHLHLSFLARLERALDSTVNNILCIGLLFTMFVGLLHSSVSHYPPTTTNSKHQEIGETLRMPYKAFSYIYISIGAILDIWSDNAI